MNNKKHAPDISYFRLSLTAFLKESHPERLKDNRFILACADASAGAYEQTIRNGGTPQEAIEEANAILYKDLHFSKHDILVNILWNEFAGEISEDEAKQTAIDLLPQCEAIFAQYPLSDHFAYQPEYELLYTELTGTISLLIESRNQ